MQKREHIIRDIKIFFTSFFVLLFIFLTTNIILLSDPDDEISLSKNIEKLAEVSTSTNTLAIKKQTCPKGFGDENIYFPVSKTNFLSEDFVPSDLVPVPKDITRGSSICLKKEVLENLLEMFKDAKEHGYQLEVASSYRSFAYQTFLFDLYFLRDGEDANRYSAKPGRSEHQLGTTVDLTAVGYPSTYHEFLYTPEGKWLSENAMEYGFVMSYEEGKEETTGYIFEPWHYRYVGRDISQVIHESGLTPFEYLESIKESEN